MILIAAQNGTDGTDHDTDDTEYGVDQYHRYRASAPEPGAEIAKTGAHPSGFAKQPPA